MIIHLPINYFYDYCLSFEFLYYTLFLLLYVFQDATAPKSQ